LLVNVNLLRCASPLARVFLDAERLRWREQVRGQATSRTRVASASVIAAFIAAALGATTPDAETELLRQRRLKRA
jgi:hypothetical protein